jgi:hypothetical protein
LPCFPRLAMRRDGVVEGYEGLGLGLVVCISLPAHGGATPFLVDHRRGPPPKPGAYPGGQPMGGHRLTTNDALTYLREVKNRFAGGGGDVGLVLCGACS